MMGDWQVDSLLGSFMTARQFSNLRGCQVYFIFTNLPKKILKIGTPIIITITVLQLEQLDFTVQ